MQAGVVSPPRSIRYVHLQSELCVGINKCKIVNSFIIQALIQCKNLERFLSFVFFLSSSIVCLSHRSVLHLAGTEHGWMNEINSDEPSPKLAKCFIPTYRVNRIGYRQKQKPVSCITTHTTDAEQQLTPWCK